MQEKISTHNINRDFLFQLQKDLGGTISGNRYTYDPEVAEGYQYYVYVPTDIHIVIANYVTKRAISFKRTATNEDIYTFRAGIIENNPAFLKIDNQNVSTLDTISSPITLTKSKYKLEMSFEPNTHVMGVSMNISPPN